MGELNGTIVGGTPPYAFVVRKIGETTGNRCVSGCNTLPLDFTSDVGNNSYYFLLNDSSTPSCVIDSREIDGGVSNLDCGVTQPEFDAVLIQPTCGVGGYDPAVLQLTNITDGARYKICYNTTTMDCAVCTASDGVIGGSSLNITLDTPTIPGSRGVLLRVYKDATCSPYKEFFGTIVTPVCTGQETPDFEVEEIQPYCSLEIGGSVQNAVLKLRNITNATRYKVCYNTSVFNCANCGVSDGIIVGSSVDIPISAPSMGISQDVVVRTFNGTGCDYHRDYLFSIHSPNCDSNEFTLMNLDLQVFHSGGDSPPTYCDVTSSYNVEYDFYVTPNTIGMSENGVQVRTSGGSDRTLPNGNDVPNVFIAAGFKPLCGGGTDSGLSMINMFYRFTWNMSRLRAKYPNINEFTFDVFARKVKDNGFHTNTNIIRPYINGFFGVTMTRQLYANNAHDALRNPLYAGSACSPNSPGVNNCSDPYNVYANESMSDVHYETTVIGSRKIATIKYNYSTKQVTWIEVAQ